MLEAASQRLVGDCDVSDNCERQNGGQKSAHFLLIVQPKQGQRKRNREESFDPLKDPLKHCKNSFLFFLRSHR